MKLLSARTRMGGVLLSGVLAAACAAHDPDSGAAAGDSGDSVLSVFAVNYPVAYFAERIGGERVDVEFPAPPGVDPAFWTPDPETVTAFQNADLVLLNGAGYARWVQRVTLPESKLVDTAAAFRERWIAMPDAVVHSHGPEGQHSHGAIAFTTWLDPTLAVEHARAIRDALSSARPEDRAEFEAGFEALERDLVELDGALARIVSGRSDVPLLASHPVYQYLARRFDLDVTSVHFEPDVYPDESAWEELSGILSEHPASWMLWEAPPIDETARRLSDLGIRTVVYEPAGNAPSAGDFLAVMRANARALEQAFENGS